MRGAAAVLLTAVAGGCDRPPARMANRQAVDPVAKPVEPEVLVGEEQAADTLLIERPRGASFLLLRRITKVAA